MHNLITDSQDEQTLEDLFKDADQIHIPIFQRSYIWTQKQFDELLEDIRLIRSEVEESQFLGAIVAYERPRQAQIVGRLKALAIVDGQQRLLTLYVFVMCLVECVAEIDKDEGIEIVREFLLLPTRRGLEVNTRLVPAFPDRSQFRVLWDRLNSPDVLQGHIDDNPPNPPPPSGEADGTLVKQYHRMLRFLRRSMPDKKEEKIVFLRNVLDVITRRLTFVHLKLNDASTATKIFERLNFRGVKVGIVDLVRNEVFSGIADNPTEAQRVFHHVWRPFEAEFGGRSEAFFFPYCLVQNSNSKMSELFSQLRETWKTLSPEEIVGHMKPYQLPFMSIDSTGVHPKYPDISIRLERLVRMRRPSSVYSYVMSMLYARDNEEINDEQCIDLLDTLETFLIRRAILGFEPTGLHALFKGLWAQLPEHNSTGFISVVGDKPTIQWPSDDDLTDAIRTRQLARTNICNYLLVEYDRSLPGDDVSAIPTIEHIMPQSYESNSDWSKLFSRDHHKNLKDTWANLIPLSSPMNSSLQADPYSLKRPRYKAESMFISSRDVAEKWEVWTPNSIEERAQILSVWAIERWPHTLSDSS